MHDLERNSWNQTKKVVLLPPVIIYVCFSENTLFRWVLFSAKNSVSDNTNVSLTLDNYKKVGIFAVVSQSI